jgi:predicted transcriptional regulator
MNLNNLYEKPPAFTNQATRKHREQSWTFNHDTTECHKGLTTTSEFVSVLSELAHERNRTSQMLIQDALWHFIERDRDIWMNKQAFRGDETLTFKCSRQLHDRVDEFCKRKSTNNFYCSISIVVKQAIVEWFEQSGTDFNELVIEEGGDGI